MKTNPNNQLRWILFTFALFTALIIGCRQNRENAAEKQWQYPVRFGDTRGQVHELLGSPSPASHDLVEEYPSSGISVWFNTEGRVSKLNFQGVAAIIYTGDSIRFLPSDRQVLFDLSSKSREEHFRQTLGDPTTRREEGASATRELHCVWKVDGYLIDALFLAAPRAHGDSTYEKGSLLWFEVSPSL